MNRWVALWLMGVFWPSLDVVAETLPIKITALERRDRGDTSMNGNVAVAISLEFYTVTLKNQSLSKPLDGLTAEYRIFVFRDNGHTRKRDAKLEKVSGMVEVPSLQPGDDHEFDTSVVKVRKTSLRSGYYYTNHKQANTSDELVGIWIRVMKDGKMVAEFANRSTLMRSEEF